MLLMSSTEAARGEVGVYLGHVGKGHVGTLNPLILISFFYQKEVFKINNSYCLHLIIEFNYGFSHNLEDNII